MENHPIPQDITGFQFKLIGAMTIKQFAYLVSGVIFAWLIYIFPIPFLIKIPLALFIILFCVMLAFVPVSGRPMDIMIINLIKALFSPTQYVYKKTGGDISKIPNPNTQAQNPKAVSIQPQASQVSKSPDASKAQGTPFHGFGVHLHKPKHADTKEQEQEDKKTESINEGALKKQFEGAKQIALQKQLEIAKKEEEKSLGQPSFEEAHEKVLSLSEQLQQAMVEKQELERQLIELQKKLMGNQGQQAPLSNPEPKTSPSFKTASSATSGLPLTPEAPNVIMGIAKDPRGNPLSNILVEVKDAEENPVRAFKTNGLGHFASATPLSNGTYTVHLEDPKGLQKFDPVQFVAEGEIISPIEVISIDAREELRRTLFN